MSSKPKRQPSRRANELDGKRWTRYSVSVWNDIRKSAEEMRTGHPAMFPAALPARLIECFSPDRSDLILDPFCGTGNTLLAAQAFERDSIGLELSGEFIQKARCRLEQAARKPTVRTEHRTRTKGGVSWRLIQADARRLELHVEDPIGLCITSPPYWDILNQRRSADRKAVRNYGSAERDLGKIVDYGEFLDELGRAFAGVFRLLLPGRFCAVVVMDIRKGSRFYPFHMDLTARMEEIGFRLDDLIIWDRRQEYNHLRPLGYPAVFRINKVHEFILIFQKPS